MKHGDTNSGQAEMISCYLTVTVGQVKPGFVFMTLMEMIFQVRVLPPPSRRLHPSHHPSEGECHVVKCERLCVIADLGSAETMTFKYESVNTER